MNATGESANVPKCHCDHLDDVINRVGNLETSRTQMQERVLILESKRTQGSADGPEERRGFMEANRVPDNHDGHGRPSQAQPSPPGLRPENRRSEPAEGDARERQGPGGDRRPVILVQGWSRCVAYGL